MIKVFYYNVDDVLRLYQNECPQALAYHITATDDADMIPSLDDPIELAVIDKIVVSPPPKDFSDLIDWIRTKYIGDDTNTITISMTYLQELEAIREEAEN